MERSITTSLEGGSTSVLPLTNKPISVESVSNESSIQSNWHLKFSISELNTFSGIVQEAVSTGVITGLGRREIIQVLWTYILKYTMQPTSEHYITICQKLIEKYPKLRDTEGQSHFVSS